MRPPPRGARHFVVVALAIALVGVAYTAELTASSLAAKLAWLNVRFIGICVLPMAALALALRWAEIDRRMTRGRWLALGVIPALTLALAWTNGWHELVIAEPVLVQRDGYVMRTASSGVMFWIFVLHAYLCILAVVLVYAWSLFRTPLHRRQAWVLLVASLLPWLANAIYLFGTDPLYDVSQIGYGAACLCWAWGLRRERLFDLVPVARDRVFESLTEPVLVLDAGGRIIDANPAAARLFGADTRLEGATLATLLGADLAERVSSGATIAFLGRSFEIDSAVVHGARRASATVLTLRDITSRREIEAAREQALRLAQEASEARGRFLASMSHEVRGPLHGIAGSADLLLSSALDPLQRRYVDAVAASSRALLALANELLDFSRLEARSVPIAVAEVAVQPALEEVARMFAGTADRKGLRLAVDAAGALQVRADAARLRQILVNLVGNAVKFTDRGSVELRARLDGSLVRFEVSDTGIGVSESAHARIFEPFVQVHEATGGSAEGAGLGLAIARQLVELMGGAMRVASAPGAGSTFSFQLPAAVAAQPAAAPAAAAPAARRAGRVLLVDDNEVHRLVTAGLLAREGCDVKEVSGAAEAIAARRAAAFDLIVTDVRMPGMSGYELAGVLRGLDGGRHTPIVALTGDVYDGAAAEARGAGMDDWLAKPVEPAALVGVLGRWLPPIAGQAAAAPELPDLGSFVRSQPAIFAQVRRAFRARVPEDVRALLDAARAGDWRAVRDLAHALKSAASIAGAQELELLCRRLELAKGADAMAELDRLPAASQRALDAVAA